MTPSDVAARVRAVLAQAPVVDGHNDLAWALRGRADRAGAAGPVDVLDVADLAVDQSAAGLHTDLPRLRAGGVGGQFWSVYVPDTLAAEAAVVATLEQIDTVRRLVARHPDDLMLATTAEDVERAAARGRIAALLGMEGGHCIAGSLGVLRMMAALGVRYLTLTHRHNTPWAGCRTSAARWCANATGWACSSTCPTWRRRRCTRRWTSAPRRRSSPTPTPGRCAATPATSPATGWRPRRRPPGCGPTRARRATSGTSPTISSTSGPSPGSTTWGSAEISTVRRCCPTGSTACTATRRCWPSWPPGAGRTLTWPS